MSNPSAAVAARYGQIAAERAVHGVHGRPLDREESQALYADLYGPVPDDPEATAWARRLFGEVGEHDRPGGASTGETGTPAA